MVWIKAPPFFTYEYLIVSTPFIKNIIFSPPNCLTPCQNQLLIYYGSISKLSFILLIHISIFMPTIHSFKNYLFIFFKLFLLLAQLQMSLFSQLCPGFREEIKEGKIEPDIKLSIIWHLTTSYQEFSLQGFLFTGWSSLS